MKKTITLTEQQWEEYEDKFGGLMRKIAHNINGDSAICCHVDNYGDLRVAAIESINGFHRKTGDSFEEMMNNPLFTKYTKTCLWNCKNSKGSKIQKKYEVTNALPLVSPLGETAFDIEDESLRATYVVYDVETNLSSEERRLLRLILNDPTALSKTGKINVAKLAKAGKISCYSAKKALNKINTMVERCL